MHFRCKCVTELHVKDIFGSQLVFLSHKTARHEQNICKRYKTLLHCITAHFTVGLIPPLPALPSLPGDKTKNHFHVPLITQIIQSLQNQQQRVATCLIAKKGTESLNDEREKGRFSENMPD